MSVWARRVGCLVGILLLLAGMLAHIRWRSRNFIQPRPPGRTVLLTIQSGARQGEPVGPVGDIDGDGHVDFLLGGEVFSGSSGHVLDVSETPSPESATLEDIDGDGVEEYLDSGTCGHYFAWFDHGTAEYTAIVSGRTHRELGRVKHESPFTRTWPAVIGDVNTDGVPDFIVPGERDKYFVVSGRKVARRWWW